MRGLLGILGISIMSLLVFNPVYAMDVMEGTMDNVETIETPFGTFAGKVLYVDATNAASIIEPPGGDNDGVGKFLFSVSSPLPPGTINAFICSAVLLAESTEVPIALTAAHCVTDANGNLNLAVATVTFETACGDEVIGVEENWTQIHPNFVGDGFLDTLMGFDIALIELEKFPDPCTPPGGAPDNVDRYFIDRNSADDIGLAPEDVGFGRSGTGNTGDIIAPGTKRQSTNTYDEGDSFLATLLIPTSAGSFLVDDFDNGIAANDAMAFIGLTVDAVGEDNEGLSAGGDSGGPHFNGAKEITAVTSWGAHFMGGPDPAVTPDIDGVNNSSFGEWSGDTRVATYAGFVDSAIQVLEENKNGGPSRTAVGGEFIPIDATAVLIAGIQTNALSVLSAFVVIGAIAFSVLVITVKRKQN